MVIDAIAELEVQANTQTISHTESKECRCFMGSYVKETTTTKCPSTIQVIAMQPTMEHTAT